MFSYLLVTGPPFDKELWAAVEKRIIAQGHGATAVSLFTGGDGSLNSESQRLAQHISKIKHPVVLIAHGAAIPIAIEASRHCAPSGLVLSNGPISSMDRFTYGLTQWAAVPRALTEKLISPARTMALLSSSIGLRRLVVNPYVMDHDTTVTVCGPIFDSTDRLTRMRLYLDGLENYDWKGPPPTLPLLICFGDADPLTLCNYKEILKKRGSTCDSSPVPGGRYLHPIERPWELADRSIEWAQTQLTTT